ncbi:MAG TPA: ABC transporter permease subunit [Polyangiaceae bacterium]|nr:ABC transporter permease subunit [Polyangiaceae bacterium]
MAWFALFKPNRRVTRSQARLLTAAWLASFVAAWSASRFDVLPTPAAVFAAVPVLFTEQGLLGHLASSLYSNLAALAWAAGFGTLFAYASVVPVLRPLGELASKVRFLGFAGVSVAFTLWLEGGHALKVALVAFGMAGFFVAGLTDEIRAIPRERYDYARTLGLGEWRVVWEVVVLGTLDRALDILRQNAAMGWMLLTTVETLVRSEGGIGVLLANQSKHYALAQIAALQLVIFAVGMLQDHALGAFKTLVCPYAALKLEDSKHGLRV